MTTEPKRLVLTHLGRIAYRHGVLTSHEWWGRNAKDFNQMADDGVEWELACEERIAGLQAMLDLCRRSGLDALRWKVEDDAS